MGVGAPWLLLVLLSAALAPPVPWSVAAAALSGALLALILRRWPGPAAAAAVLGAAPLVAAAVGAGGGRAAVGAGIGAWLLVRGCSTLAWGCSTLPRTVPLAVAAVGGVEALRASLSGMEPLDRYAWPLLAAGLAVGGLAMGPGRGGALSVAVAGTWVAVLAGRAALVTPTTAEAAVEASRRGVAGLHEEALAARPDLALAVVSAGASLPARIAERITAERGPGELLQAGWDPAGAALSPGQRAVAARWLDAHGRGGAALRLLREDIEQPEVAWLFVLLARVQGEPEQAARFAHVARPPAGVPALPGTVDLAWAFLTNGQSHLDFEASTDLDGLVLATRGASYRGLPAIGVRFDAGPSELRTVPDGAGALAIQGPLSRGPHRLEVSFSDDLSTAEGDRNVFVDAFSARAAGRGGGR